MGNGKLEKGDTRDRAGIRFNQLTTRQPGCVSCWRSQLQGWVITFRDRDEINLSAQPKRVKRYVDNLRIMRHEQLNRMTALPGSAAYGSSL